MKLKSKEWTFNHYMNSAHMTRMNIVGVDTLEKSRLGMGMGGRRGDFLTLELIHLVTEIPPKYSSNRFIFEYFSIQLAICLNKETY